ncbi:unnamed protein product [Bemisia tabaci]|uniref:Nose resistant-to-fluoxetine protein N-terminal domain-containing protein n=1 Tax=Bemisia tabaci TaxID=7038 RepID=A0A9P0A704_BEMTA|nr:unnamed protein product [Bemisia tabaci]
MRTLLYPLVLWAVLVSTESRTFSSIIRRDFRKSPLCQRQSEAYTEAFQNFTLWAVQMYDASAKLPNGILAANNYHLGNFDECLAISADLGKINGGQVDGKYCLVKLQLGTQVPHSPPRVSIEFNPFENAWDKIRPSGELTIWRRDEMYWGVCVPSGCRERDIQRDVDEFLQRSWFADHVTATVNASFCQTRASVKSEAQSETLDRITMDLFIVLIALTIGSTVYDFYFNEDVDQSNSGGVLMKLFMCFSMRQNLRALFVPKLYQPGFDAMTGARTILTLLVLYGHRWRMLVVSPIIEASTYEEKSRSFTFMTTCLIIINSFFVISGFIVGYFFYAELEKRDKAKKLSLSVIISPLIYRFLRFTPLYAVVILLNLTLLPKLSSGPIWPKAILPEVEHCRESWWTNLLYINNYYMADKMCMFQSWYLSTDMQLFIVALVLLYIYKQNEVLAKRLFAAAIFVPIICQGIMIYARDDPAYMIVDEQRMKKVPGEYYYMTYYIPTHFRLPCYLIGVIAGVYAWKAKDTPPTLSLLATNLYTAALVAFSAAFQSIGHEFTRPSSMRDSLVLRTLYGCLHCSVWAFCSAMVIYLNLRREGGWFQRVFLFYPFILFSKLSFGAYLLHSMTQSIEFGSLRAPKTPSRQEEYWMTAGDVIFVHLFSCILCLLVEVPFSRIQKLILLGGGKSQEAEPSGEAKKVE